MAYADDMPAGAKTDPQYAGLYISSSAATAITALNTPLKAAGTYAALGATGRGFLADTTNKRITRTGRETVVALVTVQFTADIETATDVIDVMIYKNGSAVTGAKLSPNITSGTPKQAAVSALVSFDVGDYVEVWVQNTETAADITLTQLMFSVYAG